jgi:hypothetical protein
LEFMSSSAVALSDDEFQTLFNVKKGDIHGAFYKATGYNPAKKR